MKTSIKLLKAYNVLNLIRGLIHRGIVLPSVTAATKRICKDMRGEGRSKHKILSETIMKWKLNDAECVVREQEETNTRIWRENERVLRDLLVSERFFEIWEKEKVARKRELEEKRARKVTLLIEKSRKEKSKRRVNKVVELRGIDVSEKQLDNKFESEPRKYGGVELSCEETAFLRLHPKFAIYEVPCTEDLETEIEKGLTKFRWTRMGEGEEEYRIFPNNNVSRSGIRLDSESDSDRPNSSDEGDMARSRSRMTSTSRVSTTTTQTTVSQVSVSEDSSADRLRPRSRTRLEDIAREVNDSDITLDLRSPLNHSHRPSTSTSTSSNNNNNCDLNIVGSVLIQDDDDRSTNANNNINDNSDTSGHNRPTPTDVSSSVRQNRNDRIWPFDPETSTIDLRYLRSTDLPFNGFVHMPPPLKEDEEMKFQNLKRDLIKVANRYVSEIKDKTPRGADAEYANLSEDEAKGLKNIKKREDIVVFQTDKSGRMAVDSKQNYIKATETHTMKDAIIDDSTHERNQKEVNAHSTMWVRIMKAGELTSTNSVKGTDRVRNSMKVFNHGYAPLYTLRKDHKNVDDQTIGPPTRPVCGGNAAYNHRLSYFLGLLLRPVWQEKETSCLSTEEMLAAIQSVNESGRLDERCTVGSADVTALYPSIDVEIAATKVNEMFVKSGVEVADVDTRELGLYLALNRTRPQLAEAGIAERCPTRRTNKGRPLNMTGCAQSATALERYKPWMTKRMLGEALAAAVEYVMKNYIYTFNGKARQQREGGPIGLGLTGDIAQILMCWWDKELMKRLRERGMEVMLYNLSLLYNVSKFHLLESAIFSRGSVGDDRLDKDGQTPVAAVRTAHDGETQTARR